MILVFVYCFFARPALFFVFQQPSKKFFYLHNFKARSPTPRLLNKGFDERAFATFFRGGRPVFLFLCRSKVA